MRFLGFRTPRHQQFDYKPRFWDPEQEEREARRRHRELIQEKGIEGTKERIRSGFVAGRGGAGNGRYRSRQVRRSNLVFILVALALVAITYVMLVVYLPRLEAWVQ